MAIVELSPAFIACRGRIGNLVMVNRYGRQYARAYVKPRNPDTPAQRAGRAAFAAAVRAWQALSDDEKRVWNLRSRRMRTRGYNAFISAFMQSPGAGPAPAPSSPRAASPAERIDRASGVIAHASCTTAPLSLRSFRLCSGFSPAMGDCKEGSPPRRPYTERAGR
jgi:hypothetical protein